MKLDIYELVLNKAFSERFVCRHSVAVLKVKCIALLIWCIRLRQHQEKLFMQMEHSDGNRETATERNRENATMWSSRERGERQGQRDRSKAYFLLCSSCLGEMMFLGSSCRSREQDEGEPTQRCQGGGREYRHNLINCSQHCSFRGLVS